MDLSILVPWRPGDPDREKAWAYAQKFWQVIEKDLSFSIEVIQGEESGVGPFNCAQAINSAFNVASGKFVAIYGADCLPSLDSLQRTWFALYHEGLPWVPMYSTVEYYDKATSEAIYRGGYPSDFTTDPKLNVPFQTAFLAMPRSVYKATGGHDERFIGWGAEDAAFRRVLHVLFGDQVSINLPMRCLWHATGHRSMSRENYELCREYEVITRTDEMLEYLQKRGSWV